MKRRATKILSAGFILVVVFLFCAFALLPQPVQAQAVTATIPVGGIPVGVAVTPNGEYVYIINSNNGAVSVITTAAPTSSPTAFPTSTPTISPTSTVPEFPTITFSVIVGLLFVALPLLIYIRKRRNRLCSSEGNPTH